MKKLKFTEDTFDYTILHPNGLEILTVKIPQSCVKWKTVHHKGQDMPVPDGFDETGETLIRVARYDATCVTTQYQQDLGEFNNKEWESKSYFKTQQLMKRKREMFGNETHEIQQKKTVPSR